MSFAKNKSKNSSNKHSQNLFNAAKKSTRDAIKTTSKRPIQAETTGDLIGNKVQIKLQVFQNSLLRNCTHKMRMKQKQEKKDIYIWRKKKTNY